MSKKLKRVLHAVEEKQAGVWRVIICSHDKDRMLRHCEAKPGRQMAIYDRDEETIRPGKCVWVVEKRLNFMLPWTLHEIWGTLLKARASMSELARPSYGPAFESRLLRFVRRKERGW